MDHLFQIANLQNHMLNKFKMLKKWPLNHYLDDLLCIIANYYGAVHRLDSMLEEKIHSTSLWNQINIDQNIRAELYFFFQSMGCVLDSEWAWGIALDSKVWMKPSRLLLEDVFWINQVI